MSEYANHRFGRGGNGCQMMYSKLRVAGAGFQLPMSGGMTSDWRAAVEAHPESSISDARIPTLCRSPADCGLRFTQSVGPHRRHVEYRRQQLVPVVHLGVPGPFPRPYG